MGLEELLERLDAVVDAALGQSRDGDAGLG